MRILLVGQNYPPFIGGVEIHVRQIANRYHALGHDVRVAAANFKAYDGPRWLAILHESLLAPTVKDHVDGDIPVTTICPQSSLDRLRLLPTFLRAVPVLRNQYAQMQQLTYPAFRALYLKKAIALCQDVDVVHSLANGFLGWTFREAAQRCGVPFANTPFVHPHQWGDAAGDVAHYKKCDAMIGLVETDSAYLRSLGVPEQIVHTIGVSPDLPESMSGERFRQKHNLSDRPVVLYVGRMMRQKGAFALAQAMPKVWAALPDTEFVFIGPGNATETAIFEPFQSDPRFRYLGKVSLEEKADALDACTLFSMPSMSEILPTVYLEAWSRGKPVLGGQAHGLPELIEGNQAGLTVDQDPAHVAEAVVRMLGDSAQLARYGQTGKELVERKYSVSAVSSQLLELYTTLIGLKSKSQPIRVGERNVAS